MNIEIRALALAMHHSESTSASLLARARLLDIDAWNTIVDLYGPMVYSWARQSGMQDADASDVAQETFSAVASRLESFRREQPNDSFRAWLFTITRNKIRDHYRRQNKVPANLADESNAGLSSIVDQSTAASFVDDPDQVARLKQRALNLVRGSFSDSTWQAFWQVAIDGRSPQEVSQALGMPISSVYQSKSRVMRKIRRELNDLVDFF